MRVGGFRGSHPVATKIDYFRRLSTGVHVRIFLEAIFVLYIATSVRDRLSLRILDRTGKLAVFEKGGDVSRF